MLRRDSINEHTFHRYAQPIRTWRYAFQFAVFSQLSGSKRGGFCEFMPILKGFSLTWRSLANGMLGDAKINQDKTPAG